MSLTMPTSTTLTWQFTALNYAIASSGNALGEHRNVLLRLKNSFIGFAQNPWTVRGSSDGSAAGMDQVDRWSTITDINFNNSGSAHSWIVLGQPGMGVGFQFLIACNLSDSWGRYISAFFSPNAGFTGGSTTARPTATDEVPLLEFGAFLHASSTSYSLKAHTLMNTTGSNTRYIVYYGGNPIMFLQLEKLNPARSGVTYPFVCNWMAGNTSDRMTANLYCIVNMVGSPVGYPTLVKPLIPGSGGSFDPILISLANPISGEWPVWPILVEDSNRKSHLGTIPDLWIGSVAKTNVDGYPAAPATRVWQHYSDLILPTDGTSIQTS